MDSGLQCKNITDCLTEEDKEQLLSYLDAIPERKDQSPQEDSMVTVSYIGMYTDQEGTEHVFDSSKQRNQPAQFFLNQVIKGWQEGLKKMKIGETFDLLIPPELGYGSHGIDGVIPPNTTLRFKVTLIDIQE